MLKKASRFLSLLLALITLIISVPLQTVSAEEPFLVGVCCHPSSPYAQSWEDMVYYAAKMGSKIIRIDLQGTDVEKWDKFFALCKAYNLEVMGIVYDTTHAEFFSKRYGNQLKYMQVLNETDAEALISGGGEGKDSYNLNVVAELVGKFKEIIPSIRENSPKTKICINITYLHYGYFEHLLEQEVDFDVAGLDWYSNMDSNGTLEDTVGAISEITGKPIFICESNIWTNYGTPQENNKNMGSVIIDYIERCKKIQKDYNILGYTVYELFDEPQKRGNTGVIKGEAYFGLMYVNDDYSLGSPKAAYYELQEYLGYKDKNFKKIPLSSLDLKQYGPIKSETDDTSSSVTSSDTQDTSNTVTSSDTQDTSSSDTSSNTQDTSSLTTNSNTENTSSSVTSSNDDFNTSSKTETIIEKTTTTKTEVITEVKEVVDVVYEEPETIETVQTKNIYKRKGFPLWLIIEIIGCVIATSGVIIFFVFRKRLISKKSVNK